MQDLSKIITTNVVNFTSGKPHEVVFDVDNHTYHVDGVETPSPTKILGLLGKDLLGWAAKVAVDKYIETGNYGAAVHAYINIRDEAGVVGTIIHKYAEDFPEVTEYPETINGYNGNLIKNGIDAFVKFYNENDIEFLHDELVVYSETGFVGTLDGIVILNGKKTLLDWKTSKRFYIEQSYQVSSYVFAYEEQTGDLIEQIVIVRLDKYTGKYHLKYVDLEKARATYMNIFKNLLNIHYEKA